MRRQGNASPRAAAAHLRRTRGELWPVRGRTPGWLSAARKEPEHFSPRTQPPRYAQVSATSLARRSNDSNCPGNRSSIQTLRHDKPGSQRAPTARAADVVQCLHSNGISLRHPRVGGGAATRSALRSQHLPRRADDAARRRLNSALTGQRSGASPRRTCCEAVDGRRARQRRAGAERACLRGARGKTRGGDRRQPGDAAPDDHVHARRATTQIAVSALAQTLLVLFFRPLRHAAAAARAAAQAWSRARAGATGSHTCMPNCTAALRASLRYKPLTSAHGRSAPAAPRL